MEKLLIKNGSVVRKDRIEKASLLIEDGKITDSDFVGEAPTGTTVIDATGYYVTPGFVEIHAHGGGGCDFMDATDEAFETIAKTHLFSGTTSIMPTTVACDYEAMSRLFSVYRSQAGRHGMTFLGLHLEGPYISDAMRGAQNPSFVRSPSRYEVDRLLSEAGDIIKKCTAAPEIEGIGYMAKRMLEKGIVLSAGHSDGIYSDIEKGYDMGFRHITHLYSNTPTVRKINQVVYAGVREAAYLIDGMKIELIGDGHHLPAEVLKLALKVKGADKINLTTDAMRAAGTNVSESYLGEIKPENRVIIEDGVAKLPDRSYYAGSIATAETILKWAAGSCDVSLPDTVKMLSTTPAALVGATAKGSLEKGKDADVLLIDAGLNVKTVITAGVIRRDTRI